MLKKIIKLKLLTIGCILLILSCSSKYKDPEKVARAYYEAIFTEKNFHNAYELISVESKRNANIAEFEESFSDVLHKKREIVNIEILKTDKPNYQLARITFDTDENQNQIRYLTLHNENENWKIVMSIPLTNKAGERGNKGLYREVIEIADKVLSIDPYNPHIRGELLRAFFYLQDKEKTSANIKYLLNLTPEVINADLLKTAQACSKSDDDCLFNAVATFYIKKDIKKSVKNHELQKAQALLSSLKHNLEEKEYIEIANLIELERSKPKDTTINRLISDYGSAEWTDYDKWNNKRVTFPAYIHSIVDRHNKSLKAYSNGCGRGSYIQVFYEKVDLETRNYFTDEAPPCVRGFGNTDIYFSVVGRIKFLSDGNIYVEAESIRGPEN